MRVVATTLLLLLLAVPVVAQPRASTDYEAGDTDCTHFGDNLFDGTTGPHSVILWVNLESIGANRIFLRKSAPAAATMSFMLTSTDEVRLNIDDGSSNLRDDTTDASPSAGVWDWWAYSWDGTDGSGALIYQGGTLLTDNNDSDDPGTLTDSAIALSVACRCTAADCSTFDAGYDGLLAHAQINYANQSQATLTEIATCPNFNFNSELWWAGWDSTHPDLSGNGLTGTDINTPAASADGPPVMLCG